MTKIVAYLRVSTDKQDLRGQKLEILEYAHKHDLHINDFVSIQSSSRSSLSSRKLDQLMEQLKPGDTLLVSELSRLGRSLGQIIRLVDDFIKKRVQLISIKEHINLIDGESIQTRVMITLFGLFAELERDLISQRTKAGLEAARASGKILGRPKGSLGKSKLDGHEHQIIQLLQKGVSKSSIAKILEVSRTTLTSFIASRKL